MPIIQALADGHPVILEAEEWINKSLRIREMVLTKFGDAGDDQQGFVWPMSYPGSLEGALAEFFPWADFGVDEEFYFSYELDESEKQEFDESVW